MTEQTPTQPMESEEQPKKNRFFNQKTAKVAGIAAVGLGAVIYLKRKFNGSCNVDATAHVETADQPDN